MCKWRDEILEMGCRTAGSAVRHGAEPRQLRDCGHSEVRNRCRIRKGLRFSPSNLGGIVGVREGLYGASPSPARLGATIVLWGTSAAFCEYRRRHGPVPIYVGCHQGCSQFWILRTGCTWILSAHLTLDRAPACARSCNRSPSQAAGYCGPPVARSGQVDRLRSHPFRAKFLLLS